MSFATAATATAVVETFSSPSGSFLDALKVFFLPEQVREAIFAVVEVFQGRGPNHVAFSGHVDEEDETFVLECGHLFDILVDNNLSINIFSAEKVIENVTIKGKDVVEKPRFLIDGYPQKIGSGSAKARCANILTFQNKNGFNHYEAMASVPRIRTDFSLIEIPEANKNLRTLRIPSEFHSQLRDMGIATVPQSEPLKKITFDFSEKSHKRYLTSLSAPVATSPSKKATKAPVQQLKGVMTSAFACLDDDSDDESAPAPAPASASAGAKSAPAPAPVKSVPAPASASAGAKSAPAPAQLAKSAPASVPVFDADSFPEVASSKTWAQAVNTTGGKHKATSGPASRSDEIESIISALGTQVKIKQSKQKKVVKLTSV